MPVSLARSRSRTFASRDRVPSTALVGARRRPPEERRIHAGAAVCGFARVPLALEAARRIDAERTPLGPCCSFGFDLNEAGLTAALNEQDVPALDLGGPAMCSAGLPGRATGAGGPKDQARGPTFQ
jgi:hypothetical protein